MRKKNTMSTTFCLPTEIIVNIKMLYAKEDKIGKNKMVTVLSNSTQVLKYYNRFSRSMLISAPTGAWK